MYNVFISVALSSSKRPVSREASKGNRKSRSPHTHICFLNETVGLVHEAMRWEAIHVSYIICLCLIQWRSHNPIPIFFENSNRPGG